MMPDLTEIIGEFDPAVPIEAAWTPPASWYTDPAVYALERRSVFASAWLPVALASQVEAPGSFVAGSYAAIPWVVVRDEAGTLRAFHNVCRHKASIVAPEEGCGSELVCPYHGWRYGLDGRLRSAPRVAGIRDFSREAMSLAPMGVARFGPYVAVCPTPAAAGFAERFGALQDELDLGGWDRLVFHSRRRYTIACNWKVFVDNYLDGGYHIAHMHPTLDAQLDMDSYRTETFGEYSIQRSGAAGARDTRIAVDPRERIGGGAFYAWMYPAFMLNRYGPVLDTNFVVPAGEDRTEVIYDFFFEPGLAGADRFVAESMAQSHVTQLEDIAISESVQRGLSSPAYDRGRYAPTVEVGEHHFHRLLARDLRAVIGAPNSR